jgi:tripartite-type tricarboxylate transporter receptor subunit TctC
MARRCSVLFAAAVLAGIASAAAAQSYPSRPVTMVVPFPPGGNTDLMARALQTELSKALKKSLSRETEWRGGSVFPSTEGNFR